MYMFILGFILGAILPSFLVYIVYKRNQNLRKQLTKEL